MAPVLAKRWSDFRLLSPEARIHLNVGVMPRDANGGATTSQALPNHLVPTIFHETWWLDIAGQDRCGEIVALSDGKVLGRLPYLCKTMWGWHPQLIMPTFTHVLGPALAPEISKSTSARSIKSFSVTSALIAQLPKASHVYFALHRGITDTLAFQAAGFSTRVNFTVEILPDSPEALWRQLRDKTRNIIRRAQERLSVIDLCDPRGFVDFYQENLDDRGLKSYYEPNVCWQLVSECLRRGAGRVLAAIDTAGAIQACVWTVWDHEVEYYYLSTRRLGSMNGATSLLIWTAIEHAAVNGLTFDMDGVNSNNHLLTTGFGGTIRPRYVVWRTAPAFQAAKYLAGLLGSTVASLHDIQYRARRASKRPLQVHYQP
jgi:hypothetical protein